MTAPETVPGELIDQVNRRLDRGERRMALLEQGLKANTELTKQIRQDTGEIVEAFAAMQGAMKVLSWIGKAARPIGWLVAAAAAAVSFWSALKGYIHPR